MHSPSCNGPVLSQRARNAFPSPQTNPSNEQKQARFRAVEATISNRAKMVGPWLDLLLMQFAGDTGPIHAKPLAAPRLSGSDVAPGKLLRDVFCLIVRATIQPASVVLLRSWRALNRSTWSCRQCHRPSFIARRLLPTSRARTSFRLLASPRHCLARQPNPTFVDVNHL